MHPCYESWIGEIAYIYTLIHVLVQVHVQSDPAGRLIVTGEPEQLDNPWGVTPFKKVLATIYILS